LGLRKKGVKKITHTEEGKIMTKVIAIVFGVVLVLTFVLVGGFAFAQQDAKGCKDHPAFSRMPNFYINGCTQKEFDAVDFYEPPQGEKSVKVEGRTYVIEYRAQKGIEGKTTTLQMMRNYANAARQIGGIVYERTSNNMAYIKVVKDGKEIWVRLDPYGGDRYYLIFVEKEAMKQEVTADAKFMSEGITSTGHVAIYGIYFDFNKSDVKPESEPALSEIAKLLTGTPNLKVFIVGHTDNVGGVDFNMKLSQARADAVVKALSTKYKVNPQQMKAYGVGQLAPVASNDTEDGKAKNRRVELTKQ
jgi:outer membrane protein OmpA-like peptidoglycan-associated protein